MKKVMDIKILIALMQDLTINNIDLQKKIATSQSNF